MLRRNGLFFPGPAPGGAVKQGPGGWKPAGLHHTRDMKTLCVCGKEHEKCVTNSHDESVTNFDRIYKWREKNKARYNEKQREYMRTHRLKKKNSA
jgi:hypothetical protein